MSNHNSNSGNVQGSVIQQSGDRNTISYGPIRPQGATGTAAGPGHGPEHSLFGFADIVSYSHFSARLTETYPAGPGRYPETRRSQRGCRIVGKHRSAGPRRRAADDLPPEHG